MSNWAKDSVKNAHVNGNEQHKDFGKKKEEYLSRNQKKQTTHFLKENWRDSIKQETKSNNT